MKSVFRIYAKTSKGNDNHLLKELKSFNLTPNYDQHMNSFYFNSTWKTLFDLSFNSLTVQQMYVQIGQNFRIIDEQQITSELERLPFKNYIPIQRGLIQSTTLKILTRESIHMPSQNVLINLFTNNLNKQITKKEYYKQISSNTVQKNLISQREQRGMLQFRRERKNDMSYFDIKDVVEKKWWQQNQQKDTERQQKILSLQNLLEKQNQKHKQFLLQHNQMLNTSVKQKSLTLSPLIEQSQQNLISLKTQLQELKKYSPQTYFSEQLAYHPHMIFYIRKNKGRFLLKINKDNLYKHGWKNQVNWGPIRESIAASIIHQSKILEQDQQSLNLSQNQQNKNQKKTIKIWDPMCGSGTFGLVAATMLQKIPVRNEVQKIFDWVHWPVYKKDFLTEYWREKETQKKEKKFDYQLILSDKDRQTINYSIDNFKLLMDSIDKSKSSLQKQGINKNHQAKQVQNKNQNAQSKKQALFPLKTAKSQVLQLIPDKVGFACGDFQTVMQLLKQKGQQQINNNKITIITNLPYIHGRSESKHPLNQLTSIYNRFTQMINSNKDLIENVFIIIDKNINDKRHFLNVSSLRWNLIGQYTSGGMQIGLYAWTQNKIKSTFDQDNLTSLNENAIVEYQKIKGQISSQDRQLILKKQKTVEKALIQLRKKFSQIDRKYYNLPKHLVRDAHGWKRILEKRRKRHLQSAYELFALRRDKLIALKHYAREKLEFKMLRRGTVWKNKNLRFFNFSQEKLEQYSEQIKKVFENKIEQALKKKQESQLKRKLKNGEKIQTVKIRNKWNNDERKLVRQVKNSKGSQNMGRKQSTFKNSNNTSKPYRR